MILSGDEVGRSQQGNNNPYCQDNAISWFDWDLVTRHSDLLRFFQWLIRFRKRHALLRQCHGPDTIPPGLHPVVTWHGCALDQPDWSHESRSLAMHVASATADGNIYLIANAHWEPHRFRLPALPGSAAWHQVVDTSQPSPCDIHPDEQVPQLKLARAYDVGPRSVVVLVSRSASKDE